MPHSGLQHTPPTHPPRNLSQNTFISVYTAPQAGLPAVYTCAQTHADAHTLKRACAHTLNEMRAACYLSFSLCKHKTNPYHLHLCEKKNTYFTNADALIDSHCKHAHTPCDLVWSCLPCWQVGRTECVRSGAHTLSSRRLMFKLASYALGEYAGWIAEEECRREKPLVIIKQYCCN